METLRVEQVGEGVALVTIVREAKLNAMNHAFFRELPETLAALDAEPEVSVCILTGAGKAFSAGGDIADFDRVADLDGARAQVRLALEAFRSVERATTVVIAAVNGLAFGGGTELTLACDLAVASDRARFAFLEATLGLAPGYGLHRGPATIGDGWTRWLALTSDVLDAERARAIGLVQQVVPHERLLEESLALATRVASSPAATLQAIKRYLNGRHDDARFEEALETTAQVFATDDVRARVRAFLEARGA